MTEDTITTEQIDAFAEDLLQIAIIRNHIENRRVFKEALTHLIKTHLTTSTYRFSLYLSSETITEPELAGSYRTFQEAALWTIFMQGTQKNIILLDRQSGRIYPVIKDGILHQTITEVVTTHLESLAEYH